MTPGLLARATRRTDSPLNWCGERCGRGRGEARSGARLAESEMPRSLLSGDVPQTEE